MQLATCKTGGKTRLIAIEGDMAVDLRAADDHPAFTSMQAFIAEGDGAMSRAAGILAAPPDAARLPLSQVSLAAPILPSTVLCSGSNYRAHNAEKANSPLSGREPEFFLKTADCVIGPDEAIIHDPRLTRKLDCETELAIVIGRPGRHIAVEDALSHVFGYTVANDVTARDRQVRMTEGGIVFYELGRGKAFDTSLPLGPVITTADAIPDPQALMLSTTINGELRQRSSTGDMIWTCAELVHFFSSNFTLRPGMVILTGTPAGTAWSVDGELGGSWRPEEGLTAATRYCLPGDVVESTIGGIGTLRNPVAASG